MRPEPDDGIDLRPASVRRQRQVRTRLTRWAATLGVTAAAVAAVTAVMRADLAARKRTLPDEAALLASRDALRDEVASLVATLRTDTEMVDLVDRAKEEVARDYLAAISAADATTPSVTVERLFVEDAAAGTVADREPADRAADANVASGPADHIALTASTLHADHAAAFADRLRRLLPPGELDVESSGPLTLGGPMRHRFRLVWRRDAEERP